jgi:hypothetical protein
LVYQHQLDLSECVLRKFVLASFVLIIKLSADKCGQTYSMFSFLLLQNAKWKVDQSLVCGPEVDIASLAATTECTFEERLEAVRTARARTQDSGRALKNRAIPVVHATTTTTSQTTQMPESIKLYIACDNVLSERKIWRTEQAAID